MHSIEKKALDFMKDNDILSSVDKVYVALSGGADSVAMLNFFIKYKGLFSAEVEAVHVNHGIRGESADRDMHFVEDLCRNKGIKVHVFDASRDSTKVPENASEDWARNLRYNYFSTLNLDNAVIATAHTLSDQVETMIFRLARGTGIKGLQGIQKKREKYIRPFLSLTRKEIETLTDYYGAEYITDETNLGNDYARNKIRHNVVPVLKEINSNAEESFGKICDRMTKAQAYIEKQARTMLNNAEKIPGLKYEIKGFVESDAIILEEALSQILGGVGAQSENNIELLKELLEKYTEYSSSEQEVKLGELNLSNTLGVVVTTNYITITHNDAIENKPCNIGINSFGMYKYTLEIKELSQKEFKDSCTSKFDLCNYADSNKIDINKCVLRQRKEGDTFKPACKTGGKVVKVMRGLPLAERDAVPVLEYEGRIVWVWGSGFTDGFTPTAATKTILHFNWY